MAGQRWAAVWERREFGSCEAGVPALPWYCCLGGLLAAARDEHHAEEWGTKRRRRARIDLQSKAKARQATKLAEIREALVTAGYDTTAKQAAVLGVCRATAWVLLNRDKRAGPSANVIKRILSSSNVPPEVRRKFEEYIEDKKGGLYGHCKSTTRAFSSKFDIGHRVSNL
jgi:hypothetical protein